MGAQVAQLFANNIGTTLTAACAATDTVLTVASVTNFPVPTSADWFYLTLVTPTVPETAWEIVKVTAVNGLNLTVVRGQDNTTAIDWATLTKVEMRPCAASVRDLLGAGLALAMQAPPAIGVTTPSTISGTTITATSSFSGPGTNLTGTAASLTAGYASQLKNSSGNAVTFNWSGQGGQPSWLWGGNAEASMYVYNPSNFSVNYANSAGSVAWGNVSGKPTIPATSFTGTGSGYSLGVTYTNSSGKPLFVNFSAQPSGSGYVYFAGYVNGVKIALSPETNGGNPITGFSFMVPVGATWEVVQVSGFTSWSQLLYYVSN